jgi:hypothetical protein
MQDVIGLDDPGENAWVPQVICYGSTSMPNLDSGSRGSLKCIRRVRQRRSFLKRIDNVLRALAGMEKAAFKETSKMLLHNYTTRLDAISYKCLREGCLVEYYEIKSSNTISSLVPALLKHTGVQVGVFSRSRPARVWGREVADRDGT